MTPERWRLVKEIFDGAVECDAASRKNFIDQRCGGDEELQREVESLMAFDGNATSVLDKPVLTTPHPILTERYTVERELGRGGMSVVYLARDRQLLDKLVVAKVLLEETSQDPWIRQKFMQEMEALARIDHPGVVGVLDTGLTADGKRFLVMQYIEGVTLRSVIASKGVDFPRAASLIRQIGQALAAAHEKGVWHRDLKPENIMVQCLGGEDHVKLIDFGIAGIQNSQFTGEKTKVAGSLTYMAPEQFAGQPCAASDTYALGVVAYEILTGDLPGPDMNSRADLPESAKRPILKALSLRPELRQPGVRELSEELYRALNKGASHSANGDASKSGTARRSTLPGAIEMAHVLFSDLVGYSLLPMDLQKEYLGQLQQIVHESAQFKAAEAAGDIISLPTGDGMALAFFGDPTAPVRCALEMAAALKSKPHLKLRMGINSGPVYRVADINANANVAGGGVNMAQRVMDCGDAGHILVSKSVADVLSQLSEWSPYLTDLGECTVKHGVKVHLCSLATGELGNPAPPRKFATAPVAAASWRPLRRPAAAAAAALLLVASAGWWFARGRLGTGHAPEEASIAVLPFKDMSQEKNQAYFAEGLAEELLDGLTKIPGLRVAGRTSSFQFKDGGGDFRTIGDKLKVSSILQGSVRKQVNRVRIGVQLIKSADGFQMWSDSFDRDLTDIFAVQQDIARAVTEKLKVTVLHGQSAAPAVRGTSSAEAHDAYLLGRYFAAHRNRDGMEKASAYYEQAVRLDPGYARAWAALGQSRTSQAMRNYIPRETGFRQAREACNRSLTLDSNLGEADSTLAWIAMYHDWNWSAASSYSEKALALDPGNAFVINVAAVLAVNLGHYEKAIALYSRAVRVDPLYAAPYHNASHPLYYAGRYGEADVSLKKALELVPDRGASHMMLGLVDLAQGQAREALDEAEREKNPDDRLFGLALAHYALGNKTEGDASLAKLIASFAKDSPCQIGEIYAYRGDKDRAFEWLNRAYAGRDPALIEIKGDPLLRNLERDPRYAALLKKIGLPL